MSVDSEAYPIAKPIVTAEQIVIGALLNYSEWLDVNGLLKAPKKNDRRSHDDLISEFIEGKGRKAL